MLYDDGFHQLVCGGDGEGLTDGLTLLDGLSEGLTLLEDESDGLSELDGL
jgi:hypothetical protein